MRIQHRAAAALFAILFTQAAFADSPLQQSLRQSIAKPVAAEAPTKEVVVVLQLNPAEGATREAADEHMEEIVSFLSKQPGYVGGQFLRNINRANSPRFVHVTRWKSFDNWEQLFVNPAVVNELDRQSPFIAGAASAFVEIR